MPPDAVGGTGGEHGRVGHGSSPLTCTSAFVAAASVALLVGSAPAAAAPERISGKLSKPGYAVIALAASGKAASMRVRGRSFRLRPPARRVTLHLRARDGRYAGPIVIRRAKKGKVAIVGVRAGARLGRIRVLRGYAKLARRLRKTWVDATRRARARKGVPIGARKFGLVRSRNARGPTGDPDLDGISNPLDIDDDGDRILDNLERPTGARATQAGSQLTLQPVLPVPIADTANANAAGLTSAASDAALARWGYLIITNLGGSAELDCGGSPNPAPPPAWVGGLRYCTLGGTGSVFGPSPEPEFPECCDSDGDGLGTLARNPTLPGNPHMFLREGATTEQIKTGDLLIERVTRGGVETAYPGTLQYVFATVPALVSYSDTAGNSATVRYPVPPGGSGAHGNGFPVEPGPDGHIRLTLTFWRPQRLRAPGDSGEGQWLDIGGLTYTLAGFFGGGQLCGPQSAYSTTDPGLTLPPPDVPGEDANGHPGGGFTDRAPDRPADPTNTLTFTVDLTRCLQAQGVSFNPGDELGLNLQAIGGSGPDHAEQQFTVKRP